MATLITFLRDGKYVYLNVEHVRKMKIKQVAPAEWCICAELLHKKEHEPIGVYSSEVEAKAALDTLLDQIGKVYTI